MATTTDEVTFRLDRLGWSSPKRMEIVGRWAGLDPDLLESPVVVAVSAGVERRFHSIGIPTPEANGRWAASFDWDPDITRISDVMLEFSSGLVLPLPHPGANHRRFGRPSTVLHAQAPRSVAAPRAAMRDGESRSEALAVDHSPLDLHAALIKAQQDLEEARAGAVDAEERVALARREAERERKRRQAEAERTREALAQSGELAEEQLAAEREASEERVAAASATADERILAERMANEELLSAEQAAAADMVVAERAAAEERFRSESSDLTAERDEAQIELQAVQQRVQELSVRAEQVSDTLAVERLKRSGLREEVEALRADLERAGRREREQVERFATEHNTVREELEAALTQFEAVQEQLSTARAEMRRRDEELDQLRTRLREAEPALNDNARLTAELDELSRYADELEPLRGQLAEMTRHAAQVEPLRLELAEARAAVEHATAQATAMRERLEAIGRALGQISA